MYEIKEQRGTEEPRSRGTYSENERTSLYKDLDVWHDSADYHGTKITVWHNGRVFSSYDRRPIGERDDD